MISLENNNTSETLHYVRGHKMTHTLVHRNPNIFKWIVISMHVHRLLLTPHRELFIVSYPSRHMPCLCPRRKLNVDMPSTHTQAHSLPFINSLPRQSSKPLLSRSILLSILLRLTLIALSVGLKLIRNARLQRIIGYGLRQQLLRRRKHTHDLRARLPGICF
jgi:hypothetical protein